MSSKPVALNPRTKDQIVRVTTLTTPIKVLITLLTKSHDPPSRALSLGCRAQWFRVQGFLVSIRVGLGPRPQYKGVIAAPLKGYYN